MKAGHKLAVTDLNDALRLSLLRCANVAHALAGSGREMPDGAAEALVETISAIRMAMFEAENVASYGDEADAAEAVQ